MIKLLTSFIGVLASALSLQVGAGEPSLRDLMPKGVLVGAAVNQMQSDGRDGPATAIVASQFNTITPENILKWQNVHPAPDRFAFDAADRYVDFGEAHGMEVIGHTLVWHQQTPAWIFAGRNGRPADRDTVLDRLRDHIHTVVGRYRGRIHGWDVVNEALNDDGSLRKTVWLDAIGDDYIAKAFELAHDADPRAELYYNDYDLWRPAKRAAALRIVRQLRDRGLRIDGVGEQSHWKLETPTVPEIDATIADISGAGVKPMLTELDVDVLPPAANPYTNGLPQPIHQQLGRRYADIFRLVVKHRDELARVTFWGVSDADSWLNNFPARGRTNYPLLWDRQRLPKPAFAAVVEVLATLR